MKTKDQNSFQDCYAVIGMSLFLNILAGGFTLGANVPYIIGIFRGNTKPNIVTWWLWFAVGTILATTYYATGSKAGIGLTFGAITGQAVIAILSLRYGVRKITPLDIVCLFGALCAATLWYVTASPYLPHVFIVMIDFFAWVPTFRKTLRHPATEDLWAWVIWFIAAVFTLLNIQEWNLYNVLYPFYIFFSDGVIAVLCVAFALKNKKSHVSLG